VPHELLRDIAVCIVFAAVFGHVARLLKQPLILGYIAGGILLSSQLGFGLVTDAESIELISEIGLILLLFIIGLEIDVRELKSLGKSMLGLGVGQFLVNVVLGTAFFAAIGYAVTGGRFDLLYLAVVTSLSSTLIVVKLLRDKFELKLMTGRMTLGVLVVQDIWAILFMALQPNLSDPGVLAIVQSVAGGAGLVSAAFLLSRFALARIFEASAKRPELVLISSIGWCFVVSGAAERLGLSKEMGALIAGLTIAAFPYGADVISKVTGVRDFFVTLFFVSLGMKVPVPTADVLQHAGLIAAFVFVSRLVAVVPMSLFLGNGAYGGLVAGLNLAQISEFSLVILTLGAGYGHVSPSLAAIVLTAMIVTSIVSPYVIGANDRLARLLLHPLEKLGLVKAPDPEPLDHGPHERDVVVLGQFRIGQAVLDMVEMRVPDLRSRITVVDYNVSRGRAILDRGFHWVYGDLANPDALAHAGLDEAKVIVTTISDTFLKGTSSRRLASNLRRLAPRASILMVGEESGDLEELTKAGADVVLVPGELTAAHVLLHIINVSGSDGAESEEDAAV
jgi:Kef-type K+ transport system membrane component KefB/voltage-gated potassium channel Kch